MQQKISSIVLKTLLTLGVAIIILSALIIVFNLFLSAIALAVPIGIGILIIALTYRIYNRQKTKRNKQYIDSK